MAASSSGDDGPTPDDGGISGPPGTDAPLGGGVEVLRHGQHRAAARAIAAGHADYPSFRHMFGDDRRRRRALAPFFETTVRDAIPFGSSFGVTRAGRLHGVSVWLPPGAFPWSPWRKARATPSLLRVMAADPRAFPTFARYGATLEQAHPSEQYWYLVVLSVRPESQRQGLGTLLVEPGLALADRDDLPCRLETADPANVAFYRRFGFEVVDFALEVIPGGPTMTVMRRPPRG